MSDGEGSRTSTLVDLPSVRRVSRSRTGRRIFLVLLFAFIGLGLGERLGVRSATASGSASGYTMDVTYAAVTRPGLDTPFTIVVHHRGGFPGDVTLGVASDYLDLFDKNGGLDPDPTESGSDGRFVYWTFKAPPGDTLKVSLDAILAMGQQWGHDGVVRLLDHKRVVVGVTFHTWVMP